MSRRSRLDAALRCTGAAAHIAYHVNSRLAVEALKEIVGSIARAPFTAAVGMAAMAGGFQGWLLSRTSLVERTMLLAAGLLLVYPSMISDAVGFLLVVLVLAVQWMRRAPRASAA